MQALRGRGDIAPTLDFVHRLNLKIYIYIIATLRKLDQVLWVAQPWGLTYRFSILFPPFIPEDGRRIQLPKRNFIIQMDKFQEKNNCSSFKSVK
jgi:hypothetical protein